jgi:hypothetical protein
MKKDRRVIVIAAEFLRAVNYFFVVCYEKVLSLRVRS